MGTLAIVVLIEGLVLAVAVLFIVALLRSHAEILRRLEDLGMDRPANLPPRGAGLAQSDVAEIAGQTLRGDATKLTMGTGSGRTLLAFLSSSCAVCETLWTTFDPNLEVARGARLVAVTKGPERERMARLLELAPAGLDVVMSSDAWEHYEVPSTPHFVLVEDGTLLGRGGATSWEQIRTMVGDADRDSDIYRARTTSERAARAEEALAAAGITPGHPSLYPSRHQDLRDTEDQL